jgi:hypothetical protein
MRVTVDIEPKVLKAIMAITGETKKSPAIVKALHELVRRKKLQHFSGMILAGEFDFPYSNEQLEEDEGR